MSISVLAWTIVIVPEKQKRQKKDLQLGIW